MLEVGPGTGTLTAELAATGARIIAYEVDRHLAPVLEEVVGDLDNVEIRIGDVTKVDFARELADSGWVVVANLPYNVGTPLVLDLLRRVPAVQRLIVMVQREVAERFVAGPGSRVYGLPSVVVATHATARVAFTVPPQVFVPKPAVESAVVVIERREAPPNADRALELAATAFGQRRKMLRRSLASVLDDPEGDLSTAGIDPTARPEELEAEDFARLAALHG